MFGSSPGTCRFLASACNGGARQVQQIKTVISLHSKIKLMNKMKINHKTYQGFTNTHGISKKYEKLALSSKPQSSLQTHYKPFPHYKPSAPNTARTMKHLESLDEEVTHNRQISRQSQPMSSHGKMQTFSPNSKTPKARISSTRREQEFHENGTVVCHEEIDSLHSKDIRNFTEVMVTQEIPNELSSIGQTYHQQSRQKLPQSDLPTDVLSKSVNYELNERNQNQDSFIDQTLLASMRDIAQSVSKVADQEMNRYFKSLMVEQKNMEESTAAYESPMKTRALTSTSPSRIKTLKRPGPSKKIFYSPSQDLNRSFTAEPKKKFGDLRKARSKSPLIASSHNFMSATYYEEPVYQRLYDTQTVYNQRLEGKKLLRYREETAEMRDKPEITKKALKMSESQKLKPIYHQNRINVVLSQKEQRLEKLKDQVARKKIQEEGELERMMRRFNVHGKSSDQIKPMPQKKWEEKVEILVKVYNERRKKKEEKRVQNDLDFSYKPQLCSKSRKILQKKTTREGAIEDRLLKAQEEKDKKIQKIKEKNLPNFVPTLNQNSLKIIDDKVKGFMSTANTLPQQFRSRELMDIRKDQFKAKERILEGSPGIRVAVNLDHDRIIEMSPSEEQSELEKKESMQEIQPISQETEQQQMSRRPSSINSSLGIIKKFQDILN